MLKEEIIPLYAGAATIPKDDEETIKQMVPLRADAEALARDLYRDTTSLADGTRHEIRELIARNNGSFESSRALFIGVAAAGALVLALLLGFVLSWSLIGPIQSIDRGSRRSRRGTSRDTWRSRTATSWVRWRPTSTG